MSERRHKGQTKIAHVCGTHLGEAKKGLLRITPKSRKTLYSDYLHDVAHFGTVLPLYIHYPRDSHWGKRRWPMALWREAFMRIISGVRGSFKRHSDLG